MATNHTNRRHSTAERHDGVRRLRLALAQINVTVGALSANVERIVRAAADAAHKAGAQMARFPELAIPGYPPEDLLLEPGFVADNLRALDDVCRATANLPGMTVLVGFADRGATSITPRRSCARAPAWMSTTNTSCPTTASSTKIATSSRARAHRAT